MVTAVSKENLPTKASQARDGWDILQMPSVRAFALALTLALSEGCAKKGPSDADIRAAQDAAVQQWSNRVDFIFTDSVAPENQGFVRNSFLYSLDSLCQRNRGVEFAITNRIRPVIIIGDFGDKRGTLNSAINTNLNGWRYRTLNWMNFGSQNLERGGELVELYNPNISTNKPVGFGLSPGLFVSEEVTQQSLPSVLNRIGMVLNNHYPMVMNTNFHRRALP